MKKTVLYLALLLVSGAFTFLPSNQFEVTDDHSIEFKSKDPSGVFKKMEGKITFDEKNLDQAKFNLTIDVSSINTGNGMQNKKAQTEEWFDAKKHPNITFKSSKVEKKGNEYLISGDLTVRGITKQYTIPASYSENGNKIFFKGKFPVNRLEFKVGKKSNIVPDVMNITYSVPAEKK
jgi:polyisoprenoid-binding protein YceI